MNGQRGGGTRRAVLWTAGLVLAASAAYLVFRPEALPVTTTGVDRGPVEVVVEEDGETRVQDRFVLSAPVTGRLTRLRCEAGDPVTRGEILGRIYPLPLDSRAVQEAVGRLGSAEATLEAARARRDQAETLWTEARRALERLEAVDAGVRGAVSAQQLDDARARERSAGLEAEQARRGVESAAFQAEAARAALLGSEAGAGGDAVAVRSPADGRVLRVWEACERAVTAGSPILEVGDPSRLEVVAEVLSEDAVRVRPGGRARITWAGGRDTITGTVRAVEPSGFTRVSPLGVEEQRVNVVVDFDAPVPALGDRYAVEVALVVWSADDVVRVPVSALFRLESGWGVFVVEDGRARERPIRIGERGRSYAHLLEGLREGERIVVYPSSDLVDGSRVRARED